MKSSISAAFKHCEQLAQSHYENFPVASRLVSSGKRKYIWAVYAFARTADDFSDEIKDSGESLKKLSDWDAKLESALNTEPDHPVFIAIKKTIEDCDIPPSLLHDLVTAFRMDVHNKRHVSFQALLDYCRYSANPVGRLVLLIHGYNDTKLFEYSDNICTALQLTNFWQDVSVDLEKGRIYIPQEFLSKYQYNERLLTQKVMNQNFVNLMKELVAKTEDLFYRGAPLVNALKKDLEFEIRLTINGGMRILKKIEEIHYNVLEQRPVLNSADKLKLLWRSFIKKPAYREPSKHVLVES